MLRDATIAALVEILNRNKIPHEVNRAENWLIFNDTRSKILFRAVEQFERLRGTNLAWFGLDELTYVPQEAWLRLEGRLRDPKATRLCGFAAWTPKGFDWVYERFVATPTAGYETVIAKPLENRYLLEQTPDYYERLKSSYDERFYQQEVLGEYLSLLMGRVYYEFERDGNVGHTARDAERPLLWALDFNVDPMSSVVAQVRDGVVEVLDEIVLSRATTMQACEAFAEKYGGHAAGLVVYADATGSRMQTTGESDLKVLRRFFGSGEFGKVEYLIPLGNPKVRERTQLMNATLRSADGARKLRVNPGCKELIKDFEQVQYKANTTLIDKDSDFRSTHLSDALGYLVWQEFENRRPCGEMGHRLIH